MATIRGLMLKKMKILLRNRMTITIGDLMRRKIFFTLCKMTTSMIVTYLMISLRIIVMN